MSTAHSLDQIKAELAELRQLITEQTEAILTVEDVRELTGLSKSAPHRRIGSRRASPIFGRNRQPFARLHSPLRALTGFGSIRGRLSNAAFASALLMGRCSFALERLYLLCQMLSLAFHHSAKDVMNSSHRHSRLGSWLLRLIVSAVFGLTAVTCSNKQPSSGNEQSGSETLRQFETANSFAPETSQRLLNPSELQSMSKYQLKIMRNEILARHGYVFKSKELNDYFSRQPWYSPDPAFRESDLSKIELENIALIGRQEKSGGQAATPQGAKEAVDIWARRVASAEEQQVYGKKTFTIDFDDDGDLDVVGVCAMGGGGSGYHQYIAAFENTNGELRFTASGDAGSSDDWTVDKVESGSGGKIHCLIDRWLADDASCCPSGKGRITYHIARETLEPTD